MQDPQPDSARMSLIGLQEVINDLPHLDTRYTWRRTGGPGGDGGEEER